MRLKVLLILGCKVTVGTRNCLYPCCGPEIWERLGESGRTEVMDDADVACG